MSLTSRQAAVRVLAAVIDDKVKLGDALDRHLADVPPAHRAWVRSACYEALRHLPSIQFRWHRFVRKKPKDPLVRAILTLGATQIARLKTPTYAAVSASVSLARAMKKPHVAGLINSVLRKVASQPAPPAETLPVEARWNHPAWWIKKTQQQWPEHWQSILQTNNRKAPFWLRHNLLHPQAPDRLKDTFPEARLHPHITSAWCIEPRPVDAIPGFASGLFSVQDAHAQLAAHLLKPQNGEHILDACAAPGGKTGHLWECAPQARLVALDVRAERLQSIEQNLRRLEKTVYGLPVTVKQADAARPDQWPESIKPSGGFDRILLDVPCSASGVARRHPDIKWLRRPTDISATVSRQTDILLAAATVLKPGGLLLYATCSVFKEENEDQVLRFLDSHRAFMDVTPALPFGVPRQHGIQLLPDPQGGDGFYYALLRKKTHA